MSDQRLLAVVRQMLRAGVVMPDGMKVVVQEGTPQGGPLSLLLSNIVFDELDSELARRGHRFVRYADARAEEQRMRSKAWFSPTRAVGS